MTAVAASAIALSAGTATAQSIRCSAFLHERDGAWRSFFTGDVIGPRGPIAVTTGERFARGEGGGKGVVAGLLDRLCASP